ncbi:tRNA adenosine(34) deaminase TadA [Clostridia bacterium OttesenSCG-928-F22]|nr:tRNA adenosine(34) deaminase TadA [Clostridia bacterium OttesenSCG-928-F22]
MQRHSDKATETADKNIHEAFMRQALKEAEKAAAKDEVPVGAVIVYEGKIIARGHNVRESTGDPTAHAEIIALKKAAKKLKSWRLYGCSMYVTLEPCPMCAGAALQARLDAIHFGAYDAKAGCCGTLYDIPQDNRFNHTAAIQGNILQEQCAGVLTEYFRAKRKQKQKEKGSGAL